jgi:hypothetical protein
MQKVPAEGSDEDEWNRFVGKLAEDVTAWSRRVLLKDHFSMMSINAHNHP